MDLRTRGRRLPGHGSPGPVTLPAAIDQLAERWWSLTPRTRATVIAVLVVVALAMLGRGATRSPWGSPVTVLVAAVDLEPGDVLDGDMVRTASWPADLVPPDAITGAAGTPTDARTRAVVPAGSVLTNRHLAAGIPALLEVGQIAVSLPRDGLPALPPGTRVDVIAAGAQGPGITVADAARVLAVDADWVWIAVREGQADAVTAAGAAGRVLVAIRPAG